MASFSPGRSRLDFFNRSRSYQPLRGVVNFWASDGPREISFYVSAGALKHLDPDLKPDEAGFLKAFDSNRDRIEDAANKMYRAGSRSSYDLDLASF
jgi:Protein of unknown function (DUF1488)